MKRKKWSRQRFQKVRLGWDDGEYCPLATGVEEWHRPKKEKKKGEGDKAAKDEVEA